MSWNHIKNKNYFWQGLSSKNCGSVPKWHNLLRLHFFLSPRPSFSSFFTFWYHYFIFWILNQFNFMPILRFEEVFEKIQNEIYFYSQLVNFSQLYPFFPPPPFSPIFAPPLPSLYFLFPSFSLFVFELKWTTDFDIFTNFKTFKHSLIHLFHVYILCVNNVWLQKPVVDQKPTNQT